MGAFEDFVNSNLGIRQPFISDFAPPTGQNKSLKAAGIRGSKFLDLSTNFLYEKTGEDNNTDWVKIAELGEPRGGATSNLDGDQYIQFVSGSSLVGSENFIYDYNQQLVSGVSGYYQDIDGISGHLTDELIVGELQNDTFVEMDNGVVDIHGDVNIDGQISNSLSPKHGIDFTLSASPTVRGSSGFTANKIGSGFYRVGFNFNPFASINDYQVIASICNTTDFANLHITKSVDKLDLNIKLTDGTNVDTGIVTILIYEL